MRCPFCHSDTLERYKAPREKGEGMLFRRHRCRTCQRVSTSLQMMLSTEESMEMAMELAIRRSPSSDPTGTFDGASVAGTRVLLDSLST